MHLIKMFSYICRNENEKVMNYTAKQIENAKANYTAFLKFENEFNYEISVIGLQEAIRRSDYHNSIVNKIIAGDQDVIREWKTFFLKQEVLKDQKQAESKAKLNANKEASSDVLAPIKSLKKLGDFGKWLNDSKNPFRKQHFNKAYTSQAVDAFLATI